MLRSKIRDYIKAEEDEIASLKEQAESGEAADSKRVKRFYDRVDKLEEAILKKIEEILNQILPTAFAIVKDTARRFMENETIVVTATDFDRELAITKDFVEPSTGIRRSIKMNGLQVVRSRNGICCITMFSSLVVLYFIAGRFRRWEPVKEKRLVATLACIPECACRSWGSPGNGQRLSG